MSYDTAIQTIVSLKKTKKLKSFHVDSRLIQPGDCFVALAGTHQNGAQFIDSAFENGAALVLSQEKFDHPDVIFLPCLMDDLPRLAKDIQKYRHYKTIALTGSVGKTTTRHMLYQVLSQFYQVSMAHGNYNNEIGIPLTILSANFDDDYLILEMGAAKPGDIAYLMSVAEVDCGFCLPISPVHVSNYESFDQLVLTKSAIYRELSDQSSAVIDLDQPQAADWRRHILARPVLIGEKGSVQTRLIDDFEVLKNDQTVARVSMKKLPRHVATNLKMVAGVLLAFDLPIQMMEVLAHYKGLPGRLYHYPLGTVDLYDDSYNASLASVTAAINVLAESTQKRVLVFGSMGEIGDDSEYHHRQVGEYANGRIDVLISVGEEAYFANEAFVGHKKHIASAALFDPQWVSAGCAVLVKGSRFMKMEQVVKMILAEFGGEYVC